MYVGHVQPHVKQAILGSKLRVMLISGLSQEHTSFEHVHNVLHKEIILLGALQVSDLASWKKAGLLQRGALPHVTASCIYTAAEPMAAKAIYQPHAMCKGSEIVASQE